LSELDQNPFASLEQLFSIVFQLDDELRVKAASKVALAHMPWLADRPQLTDVFVVARPRGIANAGDVLKRSDQLFLMTATDGSFAVRGQIAPFNRNGERVLVFCGAPWMLWINRELPDLKLGIRDFSPQDPQLDQLFFMTTEKAMVSDLELLNRQLQEAKSDLETAQHARDKFFAQMSHEMRTPLNGVVSALALLEQHRLPEESRDLLSLIKSSSQNLMQVINYVLDVSKIEAADGSTEKEPFRLDELVESVLDIVGARALEKNLGLHLRVKPGLPQNFLGDGARLRQTLLNLVTNAIKFTEEGEVTVRVGDDKSRPGWVRIEVTDTGIGVSEEFQERIFEPFFSITPHGQTCREQGTGLGLDIVRRNVKLMEGELGLDTLPGEGSTFALMLPLEAAVKAVKEPRASVPAEKAPAKLRGTVLLVDDNETNLMLGTMLLEGLGLNVKGAASGEAAVEAAAQNCFCAVLMDINMPGIDGFEATRQIRRLPGREKTPILALTAYASSQEQEKARESGMNDYLTKPIGQAHLAQALGQWLPAYATDYGPNDASGVETVLNEAALEVLAREIGAANLERVLKTFGNEAHKRWRSLAAAESPSEMAREAHSLVSSCRSFGLAAVAEALADIEQQARQGRSASSDYLDELGSRLDDSLDALANWKPSG
jgi:signal transduction histidine kinase/FixJ family two-component response regulator